MTLCEVQIVQYAEKILQYSGRSLFFKGNYEECIDQEALKYALVHFGVGGQDSGAYAGLCIPKSCNDASITSNIDKLLHGFNSTLDVYSVDSNVQNYHVEMDWLSYLMIAFLTGLVALTLWSTIKNFILKQKKPNKFLDAFDIVSNLSHFKIRQNQDLNIFDGIRALSMMWVVIGHAYSFYLNAGLINMTTIDPIISKPFFLVIEAGLLSVDIFFLLAGFFLAFVYLRENNTKISGLGFGILQRALRIWPAFIICMLFYYSIFMQLGSGIFWSRIEADVAMCSSMWREILFVANLIDRGKILCLGWSWYLEVDFQLFIVSLLLLYVYRHSRIVSFSIAALFSIGTVIFSIVYTYNHKVEIFTSLQAFANFEDFMLDVYTKPWGRSTPYLMGLVFGILFSQFKKAKKQNSPREGLILGKAQLLFQKRILRVACEWSGFGLMALIAFVPRSLQTGSHWSQLTMSFYWGFSKPIFLFGMILTILPTTLGFKASFFNLILTPKLFHFIARVSFCSYLVHLMVIYQYIFTRNYNIYFSIIDIFVLYFGVHVVSLFFGLLLTMTVELSFVKLQRELIRALKAKQAKQSKPGELSESLTEEQKAGINKSEIIINKSVHTQG